MMTRRLVLSTGAAAAVVGIAGCAGAAAGGGAATEPWRRAGESLGDPRLDALAFAILAPNPHNRQPWRFELIGADAIDVHIDLEKRLPHTDPFDRQITIGFGCMLELLRMAAAEKGYLTEMTGFPDGGGAPRLDARRIAEVRFTPNAARPDPLLAAALTRRSLKEPFAEKDLAPGALDAVLKATAPVLEAKGAHDPAQVQALIDLCWRGWMIEYATPLTRRESIDLMRIGDRAIAANPDGIDIGGPMMGLMNRVGLVTPKALDTPGSMAYNQGIDMYRGIIHSARGFAWIAAKENTRATQLQAGRDWVRLNLAAGQAGLAVHPLSQVLQEYPEMAAVYQEAHQLLGAPAPGVVHMLARVGYGAPVPPSPRWPLQAKLIQAG